LFDKNDPTKVLARADEPLFAPQRQWQKLARSPMSFLSRDSFGKRWLFYYGAADKYVGVVSAREL